VRNKWLREETILALYLYFQVPFGEIHATYIEIIKLANLIGRTPSAVSMKMCNLARFDETLKRKNVNGLSNGSKLDELIWYEFVGDIGRLVEESERILKNYDRKDITENILNEHVLEGKNVETLLKVRKGQAFFRKSVLAAYNYRCCVSGLCIPKLLIASHIKPWKDSNDKTEKLNPRNGLCLNPFFDKAFDKGFMTVTNQYKITISSIIKQTYHDDISRSCLIKYEGKYIKLPDKFAPDKIFIEYHNDVIFKG